MRTLLHALRMTSFMDIALTAPSSDHSGSDLIPKKNYAFASKAHKDPLTKQQLKRRKRAKAARKARKLNR